MWAGFQVLVVSVAVVVIAEAAMAGHRTVLAGDFFRNVVEEVGDRHSEDLRDVEKAARTDAIGSLFVFLDLLECKAEKLTELFLAHSDQHAAEANAAANMGVD
jgi:hypothetical protein